MSARRTAAALHWPGRAGGVPAGGRAAAPLQAPQLCSPTAAAGTSRSGCGGCSAGAAAAAALDTSCTGPARRRRGPAPQLHPPLPRAPRAGPASAALPLAPATPRPLLASRPCTPSPPPPPHLFLLVVCFSFMCCLPEWRAISLPLPDSLKRLEAACTHKKTSGLFRTHKNKRSVSRPPPHPACVAAAAGRRTAACLPRRRIRLRAPGRCCCAQNRGAPGPPRSAVLLAATLGPPRSLGSCAGPRICGWAGCTRLTILPRATGCVPLLCGTRIAGHAAGASKSHLAGLQLAACALSCVLGLHDHGRLGRLQRGPGTPEPGLPSGRAPLPDAGRSSAGSRALQGHQCREHCEATPGIGEAPAELRQPLTARTSVRAGCTRCPKAALRQVTVRCACSAIKWVSARAELPPAAGVRTLPGRRGRASHSPALPAWLLAF